MAVRLFGVETEVPFSVIWSRSPRGDDGANAGVDKLLRVVSAAIPHAGEYSGMFLANGSRLYNDCGHPEMCTPECSSPKELLTYVKANESILKESARALVSSTRSITEARLFRTNVDYAADNNTTWGTHESYMYVNTLSQAVRSMMTAHLATRILYCGAGGFKPQGRRTNGLRFVLSPRTTFLQQETGENTTGSRGIMNDRHEPLCHGYRRLHLICGESNCSDLSSYLKFGTTALILALLDGGLAPSNVNALTLRNSLESMHAINEDLKMELTFRTNSRGSKSAREIQRGYLDFCKEHTSAECFPDWGEELLGHWESTMDKLDVGKSAISNCIDWGIKYQLFHDYLQKQDFADMILQAGLGGALMADLTTKMCALDMQFGRYDQDGLFHILEGQGMLEHKIADISGAIDNAVLDAPSRGRAKLRGKYIKQWIGAGQNVTADWSAVVNNTTGERLDLNDPLNEEEVWNNGTPRAPSRPRRRQRADALSAQETAAIENLRREMGVDTLSRQRGEWVASPDAATQTVIDPHLEDEIPVGSRVRIGRHSVIGDGSNWNADMDVYVGQNACVTEHVGPDWSFCSCAKIDLDGGAHHWRLRSMELIEEDDDADGTEEDF